MSARRDRRMLSTPPGFAALGCDACDQAHLAPERWAGQRCPACARGELSPRPARDPGHAPELVVPFARLELSESIGRFVAEWPYAPEALTPGSLTERLTPIWLPRWLLDAHLTGQWSARVGFEATVESTREVLRGGQWQTIKQSRQQLRWERRLGTIARRFDNAPAPALAAEPPLKGWTLEGARPVRPEDRERAIRLPDLSPDQARPAARDALESAAEAACREAAGADAIEDLSLTVELSGEHWTWLLLPAWVTWYVDEAGAAWPVMINGQTGAVCGERRPSAATAQRVARSRGGLAVACLAAAIAGGTLGLLLPPLLVVSMLLVLAAAVMAARAAAAARVAARVRAEAEAFAASAAGAALRGAPGADAPPASLG